MKQKNKSEELATKKDLILLKDELENKLNDLEQKLDSNAQGYRDEILTKLDGVMGELETMRQENTIGTHQISNLQATADGHEKRIKHLEKIQVIT